MLKNIFLDLDDTILNFTAGEAKALSQTLREAGIEPTEAILDRYHIINTAHWELLEEGRLTFRSFSPFWHLRSKAISFYIYSVGIDTSTISIPRRKAYSTV